MIVEPIRLTKAELRALAANLTAPYHGVRPSKPLLSAIAKIVRAAGESK